MWSSWSEILKDHDVLYFDVQAASNVMDEKVKKDKNEMQRDRVCIFSLVYFFFNVIE